MEIGVRDLKAKLSTVLKRAAAGEIITVTDRGRPVATLGPPLGAFDLESAISEGWVTPSKSVGLGQVRRYTARMPVIDALAEDRSE